MSSLGLDEANKKNLVDFIPPTLSTGRQDQWVSQG